MSARTATIREATAADAPACAAIYAPYVTDTIISFEANPPSAGEIARRMQESHLWLVAEADGEVLGYAYGSPHRGREAYRWAADVAIYVDLNHRGCGVGRSLYTELIAGLRQRGACILCAGVALPNQPSERFHQAFGFREVGVYRRIAFKLGRWLDTRWYELELHPDDGPPPAARLRLPADRVSEAALDDVEHVLRHSPDRAVAAARSADAIRAATGWRWVGIYSVTDGWIVNEAWSGSAPPAYPSFALGQGLSSVAVQTRATVCSGDVGLEPRYLANQPTTGAEMIVPILLNGAVVGTLDIESPYPHEFARHDRRIAEALAERLAPLWSWRARRPPSGASIRGGATGSAGVA